MQGWQTSYLGLRDMPGDLSEFEMQAFFSFSRAELDLIGRRRSDSLKLGLALHIGFARMTGRPLNSVRIVPAALLRHLGRELDIAAPDLVSLRALYARGRTLFDHQHQACECLGFKWMTEHQRRALVRVLRDEVAHCSDRERLLVLARQWLYDHHLLIVHDRVVRAMVAAALVELEASTGQAIMTSVPAETRKRWISALSTPRPDCEHCQSWLWSAPARHSTRQITEVLERIAFLTDLGVDRHLGDLNDVLVRRYARRMAGRPPSVSARIKEPARTLELSCFLRYCLLTATDQIIFMFQRRVADLWHHCADSVAFVDWARQYQELLLELSELAGHDAVPDAELRSRLRDRRCQVRSAPAESGVGHPATPDRCHRAGAFSAGKCEPLALAGHRRAPGTRCAEHASSRVRRRHQATSQRSHGPTPGSRLARSHRRPRPRACLQGAGGRQQGQSLMIAN